MASLNILRPGPSDRQDTQDSQPITPGQSTSKEVAPEDVETQKLSDPNDSDTVWKEWDDTVEMTRKRKKKNCPDCGKVVYNLARHFEQAHKQHSFDGKGSYCFVCLKPRKCMKSHLKVIHKIPRQCEDFRKLYSIFTRRAESSDEEDIIEGRELYLDTFERHQMGITGGRQSARQARQNRKQAEAILHFLDKPLNVIFDDLEDLLFDGDTGFFPVQVSKNTWKIGTVRSYLFSLKRYLDYLVTKKADVLQVSVQIKAGKILDRLIASTAKDVSTRRHEHALETKSKLITATQLQEYFDSMKVKEIRALLNAVKSEGTAVLADKGITNCRTYLAAHTLIRNGQRTGVILNAKLSEFRNGDRKDDGGFVFHVAEHKTAATYGPAVLVLNKDLYQDYRIYIKKIRPSLDKDGNAPSLFLNNDGSALNRQTLNNHLRRHFEETINMKNVTPTLLRKSLVSIMEKAGSTSEDMETMARQFTHSSQTQQKCYAIDRGVDKAIRVVKKMEATTKAPLSTSTVTRDPLASSSPEEDSDTQERSQSQIISRRETTEEEEDDDILEVQEEEEIEAVQVSHSCIVGFTHSIRHVFLTFVALILLLQIGTKTPGSTTKDARVVQR